MSGPRRSLDCCVAWVRYAYDEYGVAEGGGHVCSPSPRQGSPSPCASLWGRITGPLLMDPSPPAEEGATART